MPRVHAKTPRAQPPPSNQGLSTLRPCLCMASQMGAGMGAHQILLPCMLQRQGRTCPHERHPSLRRRVMHVGRRLTTSTIFRVQYEANFTCGSRAARCLLRLCHYNSGPCHLRAISPHPPADAITSSLPVLVFPGSRQASLAPVHGRRPALRFAQPLHRLILPSRHGCEEATASMLIVIAALSWSVGVRPVSGPATPRPSPNWSKSPSTTAPPPSARFQRCSLA